MTSIAKNKATIISDLLRRGSVMVRVDARRGDVFVPSHLEGDRKLVLRFGYNLYPNVDDLCLNDAGLSGTLLFKGEPFKCVLSWEAIYAVQGEGIKGMYWPSDIPSDLLVELPVKTSEKLMN